MALLLTPQRGRMATLEGRRAWVLVMLSRRGAAERVKAVHWRRAQVVVALAAAPSLEVMALLLLVATEV